MPLFQTIATEIDARIRSGQYRPGEKIPSMRRLAAEFGCNKLTVQKAFDELKQQGVLENRVGSGTFVRFPDKPAAGVAAYDFHNDYICESFFPHPLAREIFCELFDTHRAAAFASAPVQGDPALIKTLGEQYHLPTRNLFVVSGAQQGLDLTAKVFASRISDTMLFEDPTYPGAISLFKARHFVPLSDDGPDMDRLAARLSGQIRLFYTMPAVHNPTGISYSLDKKRAIARLSRNRPFFIIEDDYLSELQREALPRFVDLVPEKTIFVKSLSQTTVEGLRLGFMSVPDSLRGHFLNAKYTSDISSAGLLQKFATRFIRSGAAEAHVKRVRQRADERRDRLVALMASFRDLTLRLPQPGVNLWVRSRRPLDLPDAPWRRGRDFSFSPGIDHWFRLSYLNMDDDTFGRGLKYLRQLLDRLLTMT